METGWLANTGLRGWDLIIVGVILLGVAFFRWGLPYLMKKEGKDILQKIGKETIDNLLKEKENIIDETNTINKTILTRLSKIEEELYESQKKSDYYNNMVKERFDALDSELKAAQSSAEEGLVSSIKNKIYNDDLFPLSRMNALKDYLSYGKNGFVVNYAVGAFLLPNRDLWFSTFDKEENWAGIKCPEHYKTEIALINKQLRF